MSTNITDKEKKILIILGIFVLIFVYFYFFLMPKVKNMNKLKEEITVYNNEYEINKEYMNRVKNIDTELKILYQKQKNLWEVLPPYINYDELLLILKDSSVKSGLKINDFQFETILGFNSTPKDENLGEIPAESENSINDENKNDENKNEDEKTGGPEEEESKSEKKEETIIKDNKLVKAMEFFGIGSLIDLDGEENSILDEGDGFYLPIRINSSGTYDELKKFIKIVKSKKNKMEFADIFIENTLEDNLNFNLKLHVFGIKDSSAEDFSFLHGEEINEININKDKDIFSLVDGINKDTMDNVDKDNAESDLITYTELEKDILSEIGKYDFLINLLPFGNNMAPPTITIVGKNIISGEGIDLIPTIYGDGNKNIFVDFELIEKNGKHFVKYRTEQDSFPEQTYTEMVEFKPSGDDIVLVVNSINRKFKGDNSGMNFNVINSTKNKFIVKVINDDKDKSRIEAGQISGDVKFEFIKNE
ncbi:MAG: hypothetical protein ABF289_14045 [Clostridiales bacterium]